MTMTEVADKLNKYSNRTMWILAVTAITCTASAVGTYYGVTGAIKDIATDLRYYKREQRVKDSLQSADIQELKMVKSQTIK